MRVPSTEVQNNFGKYLKFAEAGEEIIVTKNGRDAAKMIPIETESSLAREDAPEYRTDGEWVTYEEYLDLVEKSEQRYELIDGSLYNLASPTYAHQHAVHELHGIFYTWFKGKNCTPLTSPFDIKLVKSEDNICVVQPDIMVICDKEKIDEKGKYQGVPTLVVEVLSPSTKRKDLITKLELYLVCGVKEYWIVDPQNRTVTVYKLDGQDIVENRAFISGADEFVLSFTFGGLSAPLQDIFG
ncbi:type II toxin-antitoxin system prevent-host-death family antitoxin [Siminovitchia sp. 179-K 8D1 HS]|uniref:type II toxin-antitoxin system prevent-host-death family antitoxin n=1 Tax=Siminovitchia sp. 179-K 8D1 HS TaxID=3142385 RepID=UPI0039A0C953